MLWCDLEVFLIDMNGTEIKKWELGRDRSGTAVDRARLLEDGRILVQRGGMMSEDGLI